MGYVSTFCFISGCSPVACEALIDVLEDVDEASVTGLERQQLDAALQELAGEGSSSGKDERARQGALSVIGPMNEDLTLTYTFEGYPPAEELLALPPSAIRISHGCTAGEYFEFGSVSAADSVPDDPIYLVSYGCFVMVQSAMLPILAQATQSRLTLHRVWRLAMSTNEHRTMGIDDFSYGEVEAGMDQFLEAAPGFYEKSWAIMSQEGGQVETIKQRIIHEGQWWIWMSPTQFPLNPSTKLESAREASVDVSTPPSSSRPLSTLSVSVHTLESLPLDLLLSIASQLSLPSLVALASINHNFHSTLLSTSSARDRLARAWLGDEGDYWLPLTDDGALVELEEEDGWWEYVKRCCSNGSMKNRRRIWDVVRRMEVLADEKGV